MLYTNTKLQILVVLCTFLVNVMYAQTGTNQPEILEEAVVYSFKENDLTKIPSAVSIIPSKRIERERIEGIRDLSGFIPNLYIPDYGSKLTSALYMRGIGSRVGGSAIGLYVDNVAFYDKTAYDFDLFDIKSIEVLRGPQGTLYGRNSMAGLININTRSPWEYKGTKLKISGGTHGWSQVQAIHYGTIGNKLAFTLGGSLKAIDGFVKNEDKNYKPQSGANWGSIFHPYRYKKSTVGATQTASARGTLDWKASSNLTFTYTANYEYSNQTGYAYGAYNVNTLKIGDVSYNDEDYYKRNLFNTSLRVEYKGKGYKLASVTGYQHMSDYLMLDQDFSSLNVFTLVQQQNLNSITEEIVIKSDNNNTKKVQWLAGVSGFHQKVNTNAPVTFKDYGIESVIQKEFDNMIINNPRAPKLTVLDKSIYIPGNFSNPNYGLATFFQGTINNLFTKGLSLTAGVRLDYEKTNLDYYSYMGMLLRVEIPMMPRPMDIPIKPNPIEGKLKSDFTQVLPKFALKYEFNNNHVYASVSKGYKAGGFNVQMFSDIVTDTLKATAMAMMPGAGGSVTNGVSIMDAVYFKPEYSWNYELGLKYNLLNKLLTTNLTLYYLDIRDQQIAEYAPNGQGRMIKNAGKSTSKGVEFELGINLAQDFNLAFSYGYNHTTFKKHTEMAKDENGENVIVNYKDKYVPFAPKNTLGVCATYTWHVDKSLLDNIIFSVQYTGNGKIYWTEDNSIYQKYYSLLNGKVTFKKAKFQLSVWTRNLTNTKYSTFYFETFGNSFGQKGRPISMGVDLAVNF